MKVRAKKIEIVGVVLLLAMTTAARDAAADDAGWMPRLGALTCERESEIELLSQTLNLSEYRAISSATGTVRVFDAEATFVLKNTSLAKKKPTALLPLCRLTGGHTDVGLCNLDLFDLHILVDDRGVGDYQIVRSGDTVYARFAIKFNAKKRREVTATFHFPERFAGRTPSTERPYRSFEYHLEDSVKWKGKVGFTHVSVKMPYKATPFNTHLFDADKPFRYKNRIAYLDKRRLSPENAEPLLFFVAAPGFQEKVQDAHRKVKALPRITKRRLRLIRLLAEYPGAFDALEEHADIVLRNEMKEWDASKRKHAVELYTRFLKEAMRFEDEGIRCEATLCIEREALSRMTELMCGSRGADCQVETMNRLQECCAEAVVAADGLSAKPSADVPSEGAEKQIQDKDPARNKKPRKSVLAKYFEYFIAHWPIFLAIFILMGWIGIVSRSRNKPKMKELE